ncbi:MAG: STAS domain-containing protein [Bacteroidota bacterium]
MPLSVSEQYHAAVIAIKGKFFGSRDGDEYKKTINDLKGEGKTNIVIDFAKTDLMDSSGIGVLIKSAADIRDAGGDIVLANLEERVKNLFVMTRLLGPVFKDYDSVQDAASSFAHS